MSAELDALDFLRAVTGFTIAAPGTTPPAGERPIKLATVGVVQTNGSATVTFDGEGSVTIRAYPSLASLSAGDRVVMLPVGNSYVIAGRLNTAPRGTYCAVGLTGGQVLAVAATFYAIAFDDEITDADGQHDTATNNTRIYAKRTGWHKFTMSPYLNQSTGVSQVQGRVNGTDAIRGSLRRWPNASGLGGMPAVFDVPVYLAVGDYVEMLVSPGVNSTTLVGGSGALTTWASLEWMRP